jgi:hypothetical protein
MQELLIPGKTCLVFDRIGHQELTDADVTSCIGEVQDHLMKLQDPECNQLIGRAGYDRLKEVMWSEDNPHDVEVFSSFMRRVFP